MLLNKFEVKGQLEAGQMGSWILRATAVALFSLGASVAVAQQQSTNRVGTNTSWSVFEGESPKECWAVSAPIETVNTKDGRVVAPTRGDILLMVFYRPSAEVRGQVAFTGGYEFKKGSTVNVNVDGTEFELFTEGEWSWPATPQEDSKMITAMKRGKTAVVTAISQRSGTLTKDTFSLLGFTASIEDADKRCA